MPSLSRNPFSLGAKLVLLIWGIVSLLQDAGLSFFVGGANQYSQTGFIELVYDSVFVGALIGILSSRIASMLLGISTIAAFMMLYITHSFGHGSPTVWTEMIAIAIRPALASVILLTLAVYEKRSERRP